MEMYAWILVLTGLLLTDYIVKKTKVYFDVKHRKSYKYVLPKDFCQKVKPGDVILYKAYPSCRTFAMSSVLCNSTFSHVAVVVKTDPILVLTSLPDVSTAKDWARKKHTAGPQINELARNVNEWMVCYWLPLSAPLDHPESAFLHACDITNTHPIFEKSIMDILMHFGLNVFSSKRPTAGLTCSMAVLELLKRCGAISRQPEDGEERERFHVVPQEFVGDRLKWTPKHKPNKDPVIIHSNIV